MSTVQLSTGPVHYIDQGQGAPLVLLHASPGDSRDYEAVLPTLSRSHRVLALDFPGFGLSAPLSQPGAASAPLLFDVVREFFAALELPPASIIGNSVGGYVAARLAVEAPECVSSLVLVSPGGFTPHNWVTRAFCRFQASRFSLSPARFASMYLKHRTPVALAMLERAASGQAEAPSREMIRGVWRSFATPAGDLRQAAQGITAPCLLLFGKYDPAISARKDGKAAATAIPGARSVTLPCGHAAFAEVPELFLAEVLPHLEAAVRAASPRGSVDTVDRAP